MARPSKPVDVLKQEGKSHRTKAELEMRQKAEDALFSGTELKARPEVRHDPIANKEFLRIKGLMKSIGKNDALYSSGINVYCQLFSEVTRLEEEKEQLDTLAAELEEKLNSIDSLEYEQLADFAKLKAKLLQQKLSLAALIDRKRKMMLDIDKENLMTLSAALRSIPKTTEKAENPLLKALNDED